MPRTTTTLRTSDGNMTTQVHTPDGSGQWPAAIFYCDAFGVRPQTESMAARLASNGYVVLLPDIFYRSQPIGPLDPAEVFKGGEARQKLMSIVHATTPVKVMADTAVCLDYLDTLSMVKSSQVGVTGYCMGGRLALIAAATFPDRIAAAGSFHPGGLVTQEADSPHLLAPKIRAKLFIGAAANDQNLTESDIAQLKATLDTAGVRNTVEIFPAAHGYTMKDVPVYDEQAAERHWRELIKLFRESLPLGSPAMATA
jgi:carboxymethylenebutenolidase